MNLRELLLTLLLSVFAISHSLSAQSNCDPDNSPPEPVVCNTGLNVSLQADGTLSIGPNDLLAADVTDDCDPSPVLTILRNNPSPNDLDDLLVLDCSDVGETITFSITATDDSNNSATCEGFFTVSDNANACSGACTADFSFAVDECGEATFTDLSTGEGLGYNWSFGDIDNTSSDLTNPVFTYNSNGLYTVCLTITNGSDCSDEICKNVSVQVDELAPRLNCQNIERVVTDGSDGVVVNYGLLVDDPTATVECTPPPGSFFPLGVTTVSCTATDLCGNEYQCSFDVIVQPEELEEGHDGEGGINSPDGVLDEVFDRNGNQYALDEVQISARSGQILCVSSGYFNLYFEPGCGMDGTSPAEVARRNVMCQLFSDLSNFINPANSTVKVNIWIRDINNIPAVPSGVLGLASTYYIMPAGASSIGGLLHGQVWKTINSGVDAYAGFTTPLSSTGASSAASTGGNYFHGMMAFNFSNPSINWHTDLSSVTSGGLYDLYTVGLHEITHALGFASLISDTGNSRLTGYPHYYSYYDRFLQTQAGIPLISGTGTCPMMYDYEFNPALSTSVLQPNPGSCVPNSTTCSDALEFAGSLSPPQAVYTPNCFEAGSSLSHLEDLCHKPSPFGNDEYYVMSNQNGTGSTYMKRYLKEEERTVLCDLGYNINLSYGNAGQFTNFSYSGGACRGLGVAGVNDGITTSATYAYTTTPGVGIFINDILANDYMASTFECLEIVFGTGSLSATSGTNFTYTPSSSISSETVLLRYIPVSSGGNKGNITYVIIRVNGACPADPCNMVLNGGFEQGGFPGQLGYEPAASIDCWEHFTGSPDFLQRGSADARWDIPTTPSFPWSSNPSTDTWDFSPGNTGFVGLWAKKYPSAPGLIAESVQNYLASPILPGQTYTLSLYCKVNYNQNNAGSPLNQPTTLHIGGSSTTLAPIPSATYGSQINVSFDELVNSLPINNSGGWDLYTVDFTYTGSTPLNNLIIAHFPNSLPPSNFRYVFIDDVSLVPKDPAAVFAPPTPLCINDPAITLNFYATPPGGTFSGPGVSCSAGTCTFDPAVAGVGIHNIVYSYTNSIGCPAQISANIVVTQDTDCTDCCDQNQVLYAYAPNGPGDCCWDLVIENFCEDEFSAIDLCLNDGVFSNVSAAAGWSKFYGSSQKITFVPPSTYVPSGSPVPIGQICLDGFSTVPQVVDVIYQDASFQNTDCRDQIFLDCPVEPNDDRCLNALMDTMICDKGIFTYTFFVENVNPDPLFCVKYIEMIPGPGFTVSPSSFVLGTPLCPGDPKVGPFTVTVSGPGAITGNQFCYQLEGHDTDITIDPGSNCCRDFTDFCYEIPDCCDCQKDITVFPIPKGNQASCCYQLEVSNSYCDPIDFIEVTITNPGVTFGTISPQSPWVYNLQNANQTMVLQTLPLGSPAPTGTFLLPEFCLNDYGAAVNIVIRYYSTDPTGSQTLLCEETLPLECPPPLNCGSLVDMSLSCRADGDYDLTFSVFNNSSFIASEIELLPVGGLFTIPPIPIPPLNPGNTSAPITITLDYNDISSLSQLCLRLKLWEIVNDQRGDCCTNPDIFCVPVPDCPRCECGAWTHTSTVINGVSVGGSPCGQTYTIEAGQSVNIQQFFTCFGPQQCQDPKYFWENPDGSTTVKNTADLIRTFSTPGIYCYRITPICDGKKCTPCYICIRVLPKCDCGQWGDVSILDPVDGTSTPTVDGGGYLLTCNRNYTLSGNYLCNPNNRSCQATYDYTISDAGGVISTGVTNSPMNISLNFPAAGTYSITIVPRCGGLECEPYRLRFKVRCAQDCCTGNNYTDLAIEQDGFTYPFAGNGDAITVGCITPSSNGMLFRGSFSCGRGCTVKAFRYELSESGGSTIHTVNVNPGTLPNFAIPIATAGLAPGKYEINVIAVCEDATGKLTKCELNLCFTIPPCGCICGPGQASLQVMHTWFTSCQRKVKVSGLEDCDKVTWAYRLLPAGAWINAGTTVGNATKVFNFPASGKYEIRAIVSRTDLNGNTCQTETIALTMVRVRCGGISVGGDKPIKNSGFSVGTVSGVLGLDGATDHWEQLSGLPLVFTEGGYMDDGFVLLEHTDDVMDAIYQQVDIIAGETYQLEFMFRTPLAAGANPQSTRTQFVFSAHVNEPTPGMCGADCTVIGMTEPLFSFPWDSYRFPKWRADRDYSYLKIMPYANGTMSDPGAVVLGAMDNIVLRVVTPEECDDEDIQIGSIPLGNPTYKAEKSLESTLIVTSEREVHVKAGENLLFIPGFSVQQGATFSAEIATCEEPCDLVINGDFSSGDSGFLSDYTLACSCVAASYCVGGNAKLDKCNNSLWQEITSPSSDNFLIVDGAGGRVWRQTVAVTAGQTYQFAFDLYPDISESGGPILQLTAGGEIVATNITGTSGQWTTLGYNWTADNTELTEIAIVEIGSTGFNDYGIDNIQFNSCELAPANFQEIEPEAIDVRDDTPITMRNYPNPFRRSTIIAIALPEATQAALTVMDMNGRPVFHQAARFEPGLTEIEFNAGELAPGLYFYRLQTKDEILTKTMMIMR